MTETRLDGSWMARTATEKARTRRLIAAGRAEIADKVLESHILRVRGKPRLYTYEAWDIEPRP